MALNNFFHVNTISQELMRIADFYLKGPLGLVSVMQGNIATLPSASGGILNLVPGIWIMAHPATQNAFDELPKVNLQKYFYRIVYARLMKSGENIVTKNQTDATLIMNTYADKIYLPDITNFPPGTNALWMSINSVEWMPPEDAFIQSVHADLTAIAFTAEVQVKTRRAI